MSKNREVWVTVTDGKITGYSVKKSSEDQILRTLQDPDVQEYVNPPITDEDVEISRATQYRGTTDNLVIELILEAAQQGKNLSDIDFSAVLAAKEAIKLANPKTGIKKADLGKVRPEIKDRSKS